MSMNTVIYLDLVYNIIYLCTQTYGIYIVTKYNCSLLKHHTFGHGVGTLHYCTSHLEQLWNKIVVKIHK